MQFAILQILPVDSFLVCMLHFDCVGVMADIALFVYVSYKNDLDLFRKALYNFCIQHQS